MSSQKLYAGVQYGCLLVTYAVKKVVDEVDGNKRVSDWFGKCYIKVERQKKKLISNRDRVRAKVEAIDRKTEKVRDVVFEWLKEADIVMQKMENLTIQSKPPSWNEFNELYEKIKALNRKCEGIPEKASLDSWRYSLAKWHIFLSFRGEDTRQCFTGFLYDALCRKGFKTFMDDEELQGGDEISSSLVKAIEASRISIVVFSENFADSPWCLDELVTILNCKKMLNQKVLPIFYKIEPSDVRHQKNSYERAMAKHKKEFGNDSEKVKEWRSALSEVANLKGIASNCSSEYKLVGEIVKKAKEMKRAI